MEASLNAVASTIHTHPTLTEAVMEAVANARGEAIHHPQQIKGGVNVPMA